MTGESKRDTEPWIETHGAKYPYGYDRANRLMRALGIGGIPHAVLVSPTGTIVWRGSPMQLTDEILRPHLEGALSEPLYAWPDETRSLRRHLGRRDYRQAFAEAARLADEELKAKVTQAMEALVGLHLNGLEEAFARGDYRTVQVDSQALLRSLTGLPQHARVEELSNDVARDRDKQRIVRAQNDVAKIREGRMRSRRDIETAVSALERLIRNNEGTYAATEAEALRAELLERLRD